MRGVILCETSGRVREAFRAKGHDFYSCDLLPAEDNSPYHIQADCREVMLYGWWDFFGMHPECTFLTAAGIHWNDRGRGWAKTEKAVKFVRGLMKTDVPYYLENPSGIISTRIRKPDQTIQPYWFGEDASKRTCLWLNGLPLLTHTDRCVGRFVQYPAGSGKYVERWSNQTDSGQNNLGPSELRWKERSRSYAGIAAAMADQWG